jgi:acyl-CoA synthetase (AMP-forming)/AMP-acid ligase II
LTERACRYLLATPLFHIAALHNLAAVRLAVGDTAVIHLGRFDIDRVLRLIERERVTNWGAVPTMLTLLERPGRDGRPHHRRRVVQAR